MRFGALERSAAGAAPAPVDEAGPGAAHPTNPMTTMRTTLATHIRTPPLSRDSGHRFGIPMPRTSALNRSYRALALARLVADVLGFSQPEGSISPKALSSIRSQW